MTCIVSSNVLVADVAWKPPSWEPDQPPWRNPDHIYSNVYLYTCVRCHAFAPSTQARDIFKHYDHEVH